jgi:DGQHR domain-containing protein
MTTPRKPATRSTSKSRTKKNELRLPALEVRQGKDRRLLLFAVDGKQLPTFTTVSRVHRDEGTKVQGYQRPEVVRHIAEIRRYMESDNPLIPNALVIAFDRRVKFEPSKGASGSSSFSTPGTIVIPIDDTEDEDKRPGWIVDGQQRTAAIREARVDFFPISVVGFVTKDDSEQRAQFIRVNATKPLPKSLIYELLPATEGPLPTALMRRQLPSRIVERLNFDLDSPLRGMIQTPTSPDGIVKDNSILKVLESSISDGALYDYRDTATGDGDVDAMATLMKNYWTAVRETFPEAWGLPPRKSRLMHGAGIVALGYVMDAMASPKINPKSISIAHFQSGLQRLAPSCHWTSGEWDFGGGQTRKWNGIQNTSQDVHLLTSYLFSEYKRTP